MPAGSLMAEVDPTLLRTAVSNLVDNAIRYHDPAHGLIRVHLTRQAGLALGAGAGR